MKKLLPLLLLAGFSTLTQSQTLDIQWTFETGSKILASPLLLQQTVFIGDENGAFYAINATNSDLRWKFETNGIVQAKATYVDGNIFFESANVFYLVNAETGKMVWKNDIEMEPFSYNPDTEKPLYKIDPWDDKRSEAFVHNGIIYVGAGNGYVYGFNVENGEVEFKLSTINLSPVRSSPIINSGHLYFGDWDARVYKYDLAAKDFDWIKRTYRGARPYPSFGGISSQFVLHKDRLYFGSRNHMLNVLYDDTGEKEWTYADPNGGWLVGDPVIENDTLIIGGSDNLTMFAFSTRDGRLLWSQNGRKNIYTKPLILGSYLIYTAGNGYDMNDTGIIYLLNKSDGSEVDALEIPKGVFSSPAYDNGNVFFGSYDGNIYSVSITE